MSRVCQNKINKSLNQPKAKPHVLSVVCCVSGTFLLQNLRCRREFGPVASLNSFMVESWATRKQRLFKGFL